MRHQRSAGYRIRAGRPIRFQNAIFLCAAMQRERVDSVTPGFPGVFAAAALSAATCSVLGPLADAARCDLGLAGGFAALGSLALVNAAGEPIDQPQILFVGTLHSREPGSDSRNQRRQQDCRGDHGCADQDGHRVSDAIRRGRTMPLIFALSFRRLKQGPGRFRYLWFFFASGILKHASGRFLVRTSALRRRLCDRETSARRCRRLTSPARHAETLRRKSREIRRREAPQPQTKVFTPTRFAHGGRAKQRDVCRG